ncbi:hypothetical protein FLJC2902T_20590 [Flavobacterium limnosediminis JC2902]|uniref:Secretion system C-terminal sorting domain-containing protein n=1 Tax=Flavobacterium limnosediminis JC2902 TaxID=1341181 RepID=V6SLP2_9FLAO|nr:T9SS type A sorting domain-containing protein [Flavobacterium limnosediminis]ESU27354.1 hypothetical protein FLJC2902T_20590 [Flavobacterium limnosediminis JC2902]
MKKKYIMESAKYVELQVKLQKLVILLFFLFFSVLNVQGQVTVSGAVNGNGSYTTLGAAFTAIGTSQAGADITITVTANTTETATAILGAGDWNSVMISPSGGEWTVSGSLAADLIRFNGADNVTVNGLNSGGNGLTISNASTSNMSGTSTIKFQTDATNNTITNCTLLGSATVSSSTPGGVVLFSTGTTTGNDNNTISNCKIGPAGTTPPSKLIFSSGSNSSVPLYNSGITITGCSLYDYFLQTGCAAVYITTGNTDWTLTNNKIYQTVTRNFTTAGSMYGIYFANPTNSNNMQITGNTIGYANDSGSGTFTVTSTVNAAFTGIYFFASSTAPDACNINNNTITNISFTSTSGSLYGIYNTTAASTNSINVNGNTVRNLTATTTGGFVGIYAGAATSLDCSNNTVRDLTRNGAGPFYGISYTSPASVTFDSNSITNLNSTAADNAGNTFAGIYSATTAQTESFFTNTITGLTSASTTSGINIFGISNGTGATGNKIFVGNTIYNLSLPASGTGKIYGIKLNGGGTQNSILRNTIHTLSGGNIINGIAVTAGTTIDASKNKIYGLSSSSAAAVVYGMNLTGGTTHNIFNNIVGSLSASAGDNASGTPNQVVGINAVNGAATVNLYHNTIKIDALSTGANFGSSAVSVDTNPALIMRNNILVNTSAANGTGLSVVLRKPTLTSYDASSNNNLFYGTTVYTDGTNTDITLNDFRTRLVNRDALSVNENPDFISTTGSDATYLHIDTAVPTLIESGGVFITSVNEDFDGNTRNASVPDIGADEFAGIPITMGGNDFALANLKVYPNPVSDVLQIENPQSITNIEVFNIAGQKMMSKTANAMTVTIPMSGFAAGAYFVKVSADNAIKTIKVIKK